MIANHFLLILAICLLFFAGCIRGKSYNEIQRFRVQGEPLSEMKISTDDRLLLVAVGNSLSSNGQLHLFSTNKDEKGIITRIIANSISAYEWLSDSSMLLMATSAGVLSLYELPEHKYYGTAVKYEGTINVIEKTLDGGLIAIGGSSNNIMILDCSADIRTVKRLSGESPIYTVDWTSDGRYLAYGGRGVEKGPNRIFVYDIKNDMLIDNGMGHEDWILQVKWIPNSKILVTSSMDGSVAIWDGDNEYKKHILGLWNEGISAIAVSNNGKYIAVGTWDGSLTIFNCLEELEFNSTNQEVIEYTRASKNKGWTSAGLSFSKDSRYLASGSYGGEINVFLLANGINTEVIWSHSGEGAVYSVVWNSDASELWATTSRGYIIGWSLHEIMVSEDIK